VEVEVATHLNHRAVPVDLAVVVAVVVTTTLYTHQFMDSIVNLQAITHIQEQITLEAVAVDQAIMQTTHMV
jgi:hypothetical protein